MGKFEIEGYAKRKVKCDLAIVHITFKASGTRSHELSKRVMDECDNFIKEISKLGIKAKDIQYDEDRTDSRRYDNEIVYETERKERYVLILCRSLRMMKNTCKRNCRMRCREFSVWSYYLSI